MMAYILTISNSDIEFRHIEDKQNESYLMHQSVPDIRISTEDDLRSEQYIMLVHQVEGGGIPEAPNDGKLYGRKNKRWSRAAEPEEVTEAISQTLEIAEEEIAEARSYAESVAEAAYQAGKRDLEDAQEIMEAVTERIDNRLTEVDTELTEKLEDAKERIANAEENISDAQVNIDRANANIDLHAERLDVAEGTLTDVGLRVDAAEGAIDAQATHIDTLEGTVSDVGLRLDAAEGTIAIHNNRLDDAENSVTVMEQKWDNVEATITTTVATQIATSGSIIKTGVEQIVDGKAGVIEQNAVKTVEENMDGYITSNTHFSQLRQDTEGIKATVGDATGGLVKKVSVLEQTSDNIALRVTDAEHALDDGHGGLLSVGEIKVTADTISNVVTNGDNFAAIIARINAATGSSEVLLDANKIYLLGETVAEKLTALQAVIGNLSVVNTSVEGTIGSYGRSDGEHTEAELLQMLLDGTITKSQYDSYKTVTNWQLKSDGTGSLAKGNITWDQNGNATFTGDVVANSLSLGSTVTIPSDNISGLSAIATSGDYDDIINPPHIPGDSEITGLVDTFVKSNGILDIQGNVGSLITNYVTTRGYQTASDVQAALEELDYNSVSIVDSEPDDKGIITRIITVIPNGGEASTYTEYYSQDGKYLITDVGYGSGHFDDREETAAGVLISTDGLIKAKNAIIYGTIYSHAGQIGGWTIAQNRLLSSFPTTSGNGTTYLSLHPGMEGSTLADNNGIRSYTVVTSGTDPVPGTYTHYWLKADGSGEIANGSLTWNKYGVITLSNLNGNVILSNSGQTLDQLLALVSTVANMFEWDNDQTSPGYGSIRTKRVLDPITGQWTSPSFYTYGEVSAGGVGSGGGGGATYLYQLEDVEPYSNKAGKYLRVNANGTGTEWADVQGGASTFAQLTGSPYDNTNLATALNGKQDALGYTPVNKTGDTMSGSLELFATGSAWNEGIRMHLASNNWVGLVMCGSDNTGNTGTSAKTWSIHNYDGHAYFVNNGSATYTYGFDWTNSGSLTMKASSIAFNVRPTVSGTNVALTSDIPTNNNQLTNGAGYITSSGSCAYASSAGNADTLDGQHGSYYAAASSLGNYLPLSGGTLTETVPWGLTINRSNADLSTIYFSSDTVGELGYLGYSSLNTPCMMTTGGQIYNLYHSGNCNNTSTPWSASTLSTSGNIYTANTSHIIQTGNYNSDITELSDITNLRNNADRVVHYNSDAYGYAEALSGRTGNYYMQAGRWDGSAYYGILLNPFGGNVGIGTTSPSGKADVLGDIICGSYNLVSAIKIRRAYDGDFTSGYHIGSKGSSGVDSYTMRIWTSAAGPLTAIDLQGGNVSITNNLIASGNVAAGSDARWKHNIRPVFNGLGAIMKLQPSEWEWNSDGHKDSGLVAQQVREVLPHLVKESNEGFLHLNYNGLHAYEISAIQSHESRIEQLERENIELKLEIQRLRS